MPIDNPKMLVRLYPESMLLLFYVNTTFPCSNHTQNYDLSEYNRRILMAGLKGGINHPPHKLKATFDLYWLNSIYMYCSIVIIYNHCSIAV